MTPTQRTMKHIKSLKIEAEIVEKWVPNPKHPGGGFRKDLFGIIDIIAIDPLSKSTIGVQSTGQDFSGHWKKLTQEKADKSRLWLSGGNRLLLMGWRKLKVKRGGKAMRWTPRIADIKISDLEVSDEH